MAGKKRYHENENFRINDFFSVSFNKQYTMNTQQQHFRITCQTYMEVDFCVFILHMMVNKRHTGGYLE